VSSELFDFHVRLAPGSASRLLSTLDGHGVARAAVAAGGVIDLTRLSRQLVEGGHVTADADNAAVLAACGSSGGRLVPVWFGNPHRPASWYAAAEGFRGLEISPAVHGVALTDPRVADLVAVAARRRHSVYTVCLERPGCRVTDLVALATAFPAVRFVLGHTGVGNIDYWGIDVVAARPNIAVETSGGYSGVLRYALDRLGADRLLFGSEWPLQDPSVELAKYAAVAPTPEQWRRIAWENAESLLELERT
jgi:uncharacterized protein